MHYKLTTGLSIVFTCSLAFAFPGGNGHHPAQGKSISAINKTSPTVSENITLTNGHEGKGFVAKDSKVVGKVSGGAVEHQ